MYPSINDEAKPITTLKNEITKQFVTKKTGLLWAQNDAVDVKWNQTLQEMQTAPFVLKS